MVDQWINERCWHNRRYINGKIKAVVVSFHGLNARYRTEASPADFALAESGILVIAPYYGPWSWMNRQARAFVDELLDHVFAEIGTENIPLIASGGSMGGCAALLFCRYSAHRAIGCDLLWPVCNTVAHFSERPDLPPTFHSAFAGYSEPLEELLKEHLCLDRVALIKCGGGSVIDAAREQWNDGSNTFCIAPGKVVAYSRNYVTNQVMEDAGIQVLTIPSSELSRGRGGPRCMTMPLVRERV